jgi:Uma2 family endonuclease
MPRVIYDMLPLDRFLKLPEAKPALEYLEGRVVQKVAPILAHSYLQTLLSSALHQHVEPRRGMTFVELRCTYGGNSYVHDLCVVDPARLPTDSRRWQREGMSIPPDLAVEILSPGQTVRALASRLRRCVNDGVRLAWLVQPRRCAVHVFQPGQPVRTLERTDVLEGEPVLTGFRLPLDTLFGWLESR